MPEPAKVIMKTDNHFRHLFRKLYQKELAEIGFRDAEVTCLFTVGKDNLHWKNLPRSNKPGRNTIGTTGATMRDQKNGKYYGTFLIDVEAAISTTLSTVAEDTRGRSLGRVNFKRFEEYKFDLLVAMAHEYFHLIDKWRLGEDEFLKQYTEIHNQLKKKLRRDIEARGGRASEQRLAGLAHGMHPDEHRAQHTAEKRILLYRSEIRRGQWDVALPMEMIRYYYNKKVGRQKRLQ